jgi:hypothetical protein
LMAFFLEITPCVFKIFLIVDIFGMTSPYF